MPDPVMRAIFMAVKHYYGKDEIILFPGMPIWYTQRNVL
jgi:hypothetical protein